MLIEADSFSALVHQGLPVGRRPAQIHNAIVLIGIGCKRASCDRKVELLRAGTMESKNFSTQGKFEAEAQETDSLGDSVPLSGVLETL